MWQKILKIFSFWTEINKALMRYYTSSPVAPTWDLQNIQKKLIHARVDIISLLANEG